MRKFPGREVEGQNAAVICCLCAPVVDGPKDHVQHGVQDADEAQDGAEPLADDCDDGTPVAEVSDHERREGSEHAPDQEDRRDAGSLFEVGSDG